MKKTVLSIISALCIFTCLFSSAFAEQIKDEDVVYLNEEQRLKTGEVWTKLIKLPNSNNIVYYAQNSPEWGDLIFSEADHEKMQYFGDSSCVISSLSLAIANLVPMEKLSKITEKMIESPKIDTHSMTRDFGLSPEERFEIKKDEDFFRYFPLVLGNYVCGNSKVKLRNSKQSQSNYQPILDFYGLKFIVSKKLDDLFNTIDRGGLVVTSSVGLPFSEVGHYFVLADYDDEYIYMIDTYARDRVKYNDDGKYMQIVERGLTKFKIEDFNNVRIGTMFCILSNEDSPKYTQEKFDEIMAKTNEVMEGLEPIYEEEEPTSEPKTDDELLEEYLGDEELEYQE